MQISKITHAVDCETVEASSLNELSKLAMGGDICLSVFNNGKRSIESFQSTSFIALDFDNDSKSKGTMSLSEATNAFSQYAHIILTTRSHGVGKNGQEPVDRFRVVLKLERPIDSANDFYGTWYWVNSQFPQIDSKCKDPSRLWYQHKSTVSVSEYGRLVPVIKYEPPPKIEPGVEFGLNERGQLSHSTKDALLFGIKPGGRNAAVYSVARDFNQNLYTHAEAEELIVKALNQNGTICSDFPEREVLLAIGSAYSKDAKHAPRIAGKSERAFSYISADEMLKTPDKQEDWLVEGLLISGGTSLIAGAPKIGKSTIIRQLSLCVARGGEWLEMKCKKSLVMHFSMDEKQKTVRRQYRKLGLTGKDELLLSFGNTDNPSYMTHLEEDILKYKPGLVVIDTLFDMIRVDDSNNYAKLKPMLGTFNRIAETSGAHIIFIHHSNKPNAIYGEGSGYSILGSTAIFGAVDCGMVFQSKKDSPIRTLSCQGRAVDNNMSMQNLLFDPITQSYKIDPVDVGGFGF